MNSFDIVIIGAGPAGLIALKTLLEKGRKGLRIAIIEKSSDYSRSIVCGEGVWALPFKKYLNPRKEWIRYAIDKAAFHSPDRQAIVLNCKEDITGLILDRAVMQEDLLSELTSDPRVTLLRGVSVNECSPRGAHEQFLSLTNGEELTANCIMDCSGPASRLGKSYDVYRKPLDFETAIYAIVDGVSVETNKVHLHRSFDFGPGGYYWEFPHSEHKMNAGIVLGVPFKGKVNLRELLEKSVASFYPGAKIESVHAGSIPNYTTPRSLSGDGFIQCGDAAEMVNPLTRSGITESMLSGKLGAQAALEMISLVQPKKRRAAGARYEKELFKSYGKKVAKAAKAKLGFYKVPEKDFNKAVYNLNGLPEDKISMGRILKTAVASAPRLFWAMRHLL